MAAYVLLKFDNDDDAYDTAEVFADAIQGVYKAPTRFCDCPPTGMKQGRSFTKGPHYGWWLCTQCSRPTQAWAESIPSNLGVNLL